MGIVHGQKVGSGRRRRVAPQRDHRGRTEEEEAEEEIESRPWTDFMGNFIYAYDDAAAAR